MTVQENLSFNLKLSRLSLADITARVTEAARLLELGGLLSRRPAQLSGGQRQRVAMGRAIVRNPALFLFDEPLSNLDAKLRVQMRAEIKTLQDKVRTTSIYVTHDQIEAMTLADRIVVLNKGRIEQVGTPLELYRRPANLFVAGFIGSPAMNILPATAHLGAGGKTISLADGTVLPIDPGARVTDGAQVEIGLRPENLTVAPQGALAGEVMLVEPTGAQTHLHVQVAGQNLIVVVDGAAAIEKHDPIGLSIPPGQVHLFDRNSGLRLNAARA
jgi:multiple sugar transport system ATP-binding protein